MFRWHIKVKLEKLLKSKMTENSDVYLKSFATILGKVRNDINGQVLKEIEPIQQKMNEMAKAQSNERVELVDLKYTVSNQARRLAQKDLIIDEINQSLLFERSRSNQMFAESKDLKNKDVLQLQENRNFRILLDALTKKNQILKDKLDRLGVTSIPTTEVEKRILYS